MDYFGMDIHKKYSVYTQMNEAGEVLAQGRIPNERAAFQAVLAKARGPAAVAMEATYHWYHLYDLLEELAQEVHLAHPLKVRAIAEARIKTDKIDATVLAHLLRTNLLPEAYVPPRPVREQRELLRYRASLVRQRTQLKNKVHALLAKTGWRAPVSDLFGRRGRQWLATLPLPPVYRQAVDGYLAVLDRLQEQVAIVTAEIEQRVKRDAQARLLTTIPGIGYYSALLILSEVGDIRRFPDGHRLGSYAGLVPAIHASGGTVRYGRITKQGSRWLRWILVEAAQTAVRRSGSLRSRYLRLARRQGQKAAKVAVARHLCLVIYRMLLQQQPYREDGRAPGEPWPIEAA